VEHDLFKTTVLPQLAEEKTRKKTATEAETVTFLNSA
jgi:hypothetical protein